MHEDAANLAGRRKFADEYGQALGRRRESAFA
jgi:hypothetical protein